MTSTNQPLYECLKVPLPSSGREVRAIISSDGELHEEASDWLLALSYRPNNTAKTYGPKVAMYLSWLAGLGLSWREPNLSVVAQWLNQVRTFKHERGKKKGQFVDEGTVNVYKAAVLHFYRWAATSDLVPSGSVATFYEWQQLPAHVAGELPTMRLVSVPALKTKAAEKDPEWIESPEDLDRLLAVDMNVRDFALVTLMFVTGMRIGEALSLFRSDLHLTNSSLDLGCELVGPHVHIHDNNETLNDMATKDKKGRVLALPAWWAINYWAYKQERLSRLGVDDNPHAWVNLWQNPGAAMSYDTAKTLFKRLSATSGVHATPHTLRHTRASWWQLGIDGPVVPADVVKELLGHRSLQTTDKYTHLRSADLRAAIVATAPRIRGEALSAEDEQFEVLA